MADLRSSVPVAVTVAERRVITAFLAATAVLGAGTRLHGPWVVWTFAALAALVVAALLVTWRGAPLSTLLARWARRLRTRSAAAAPALPPAHEHRMRWTDGRTAIRADGDDLIAVVAVDGPSHSPSVLDSHLVQSAVSLPIDVVADALRQFDVTLAGIDILSAGRRRAPRTHHHGAPSYSGLVGDHGAMGQRRTVCVLRMNRLDNLAAVACRDSVAASLDACARRLAVELTARHLPARVVDTAELGDIDAALSAGLGGVAQPRFGGLRHSGGWVSTYWVTPRDISTAALDRLWAPDTDHTATALQLRPAPDGGVTVGALVRYTTGGPQKRPPINGLNPLSGRHELGVRAGLTGARTPEFAAPARPLTDGEQMRAPVGASGQVVGATPQGLPLLVDLADAVPGKTSTVTVAGEPALLVQLAMRGAAIGYQVLVVTGRPDAWRQATAAGLHVTPRLPAELPEDGRGAMVVVDHRDHPEAPGPRAQITVRAVAPGTASVADVHIEQDSARTAVIRTEQFSYRINISLDPERNMIKWRPHRAA